MAHTMAWVVAIGVRTIFAQTMKPIPRSRIINMKPISEERVSAGTIPLPTVSTTGAPAVSAPRRAKIAISHTACLFDLTPAPYDVAMDAAELLAPMLRARNAESTSVTTSKTLNKSSPRLNIGDSNYVKTKYHSGLCEKQKSFAWSFLEKFRNPEYGKKATAPLKEGFFCVLSPVDDAENPTDLGSGGFYEIDGS